MTPTESTSQPLPTSQPFSGPTAPHSGPVTLRTVASAAGVSLTTASRALNGQAKKYRISASTEKAVRQVAQQMGFHPSQVARSLRLKRSGLIGVIVPDISNPFFAAIAREVALGLESDGLSVVLGDSREQTEMECRLAHQLRAKQVEALLVCPVGIASAHLVDLNRSGLPMVVADRVFDSIDLPSVTTDHFCAAEVLAAELIRYGHRQIGVLSGIPESLPARARLAGLDAAADRSGFKIDRSYIAGDAFTEQSGYDAARSLWSRAPELTALFAMCTPSAIGAMRALAELGVAVPADVSIVAFDDHPFSDLMATPLTVSVQDTREIGRVAAEILIQRLHPKRTGDGIISDPSTSDRHRIVPATLMQRSSVTTPRQSKRGK